MLRTPFPSYSFPITYFPLPASYFLSLISYYHPQLHPQVEVGISIEEGERKAWVFGKLGETHAGGQQGSLQRES